MRKSTIPSNSVDSSGSSSAMEINCSLTALKLSAFLTQTTTAKLFSCLITHTGASNFWPHPQTH